MTTVTLGEKNLTDIFRLPCVQGIHKNANNKTTFMVRKQNGVTTLAYCGNRLNIEGDTLISIDK